MEEIEIKKYSSEYLEEWDDLVLNNSINGTFLQTRNFLNYHPAGRFEDASVMIFDRKKLVAVVPACKEEQEGVLAFVSHKGSTYGGIVIRKDYYVTEKLVRIVSALDDYLSCRYERVVLKITSDIHSVESSDLLQFILSYHGYREYTELNTYIDLEDLPLDVKFSFDRNKQRNIQKCEEHNLEFRELVNDSEIESFYELLEINLSKYNLKPIHSVDEMKEFRSFRIPQNVIFYGVFSNNIMMSGGMMFVFDKVNVIHAQNLSADYRFTEYSPITYMYYKVIQQAKNDGYKALSWGISTEDKGKVINMGLIRNKESYGSKHQLNRTFYKEFS